MLIIVFFIVLKFFYHQLVSNRKCDGTQFGKSHSKKGKLSSANGTTRITEYEINLIKSTMILVQVFLYKLVN